ncbi:MAG: hypothetical protein ACPLRU_02800 [Desulfofundulus sp.]
MKRPKKGSPAAAMLDMLENACPAGVPTVRIAEELFGDPTLEGRVKVRRLARNLQHRGFRVCAEGGMYYIGNPDVLEAANRRFQKMACGFLRGGAETVEGIAETGDEARAKKLRFEMKETVRELLEMI